MTLQPINPYYQEIENEYEDTEEENEVDDGLDNTDNEQVTG